MRYRSGFRLDRGGSVAAPHIADERPDHMDGQPPHDPSRQDSAKSDKGIFHSCYSIRVRRLGRLYNHRARSVNSCHYAVGCFAAPEGAHPICTMG